MDTSVIELYKQFIYLPVISPHIYLSLLYNSPAKLILISGIEKRVVGKLVVMNRLCHFKGFVTF